MKQMAVSTGCALLLSSLFYFQRIQMTCGDSKLKGLDPKFQRHNSEQQFMYLYAKLYSSGARRKVRRSKNFCGRHRKYSMKYKLWELHMIGEYDLGISQHNMKKINIPN
ncbi:hypothetical protein PanWU01x14_258220 [Parasponia andersonii]|uniref:Uncharacterized protein n=1 Tax=Parasponia andersonii TaxID=3476 RepID=A0A2P5B9K3_PARAD|nr:hypothetical protein PanWU01x14_258220 [Parasponia andersonii]